ncbi:MAG TPA: type II toxin-antitoxin system HicB family antitoxin [Planctomycetota bacterium]|nr:type II toxin-antitoxin system HicB family antitoxin [Planctomycetota bacterium]
MPKKIRQLKQMLQKAGHRYSMEIHWSDEDQAFVVTLPEFPVCQTHGATYEEAARQGNEVLELLIETYRADGRALPEPMTLERVA